MPFSKERTVAKPSSSISFTMKDALVFLRNAYEAAGYVRVKEDNRRSPPRYFYELRFSARNRKQADLIKRAMKLLGFKARREFQKHSRTIIPFYGKEIVMQFLAKVKPRKKNDPAIFKR